MLLMTSRGSLCIRQPPATPQSWIVVICVATEEASREAIMEDWRATAGVEATERAEILRNASGHILSGGKCGRVIFHPWIYFLFRKL